MQANETGKIELYIFVLILNLFLLPFNLFYRYLFDSFDYSKIYYCTSNLNEMFCHNFVGINR